MRKKYLRRKGRKRALISLFIFTILLFCFFRSAASVIKDVSSATMKGVATEAVNDAVYYTLNGENAYENLITVQRNSSGDVETISSNALNINRIARDTAYMSQKNLNDFGIDGIDIPLGAFFGVDALSGFGPNIHVKIIPVSHVQCAFKSLFETVGINQTKHSIYLEVEAEVNIIMVSGSDSFTVTSRVLICESVIIGKIPDTYLNANELGEMTDLIH